MSKLVLVGGGGHCKSVLDVIKTQNRYEEVLILDKSQHVGERLLGYEIIGTDDMLMELLEQGVHHAFITVGGIGNAFIRSKLWDMLKKYHFHLPNIIDQSAVIARDVELGSGIFIGKNAVINSQVMIDDFSIINTAAVVEHGCKIGKLAHVSVGAVLCGDVTVQTGAFIGANSTVIQGKVIGSNSIIGAGCTIVKNVDSDIKIIQKQVEIVENMKLDNRG